MTLLCSTPTSPCCVLLCRAVHLPCSTPAVLCPLCAAVPRCALPGYTPAVLHSFCASPLLCAAVLCCVLLCPALNHPCCGVLWCAVVCCGVLWCALVCSGVLWCVLLCAAGADVAAGSMASKPPRVLVISELRNLDVGLWEGQSTKLVSAHVCASAQHGQRVLLQL
jgi:hypothetical protein